MLASGKSTCSFFPDSNSFREIVFLPNGRELRENVALVLIGRHIEISGKTRSKWLRSCEKPKRWKETRVSMSFLSYCSKTSPKSALSSGSSVKSCRMAQHVFHIPAPAPFVSITTFSPGGDFPPRRQPLKITPKMASRDGSRYLEFLITEIK